MNELNILEIESEKNVKVDIILNKLLFFIKINVIRTSSNIIGQ